MGVFFILKQKDDPELRDIEQLELSEGVTSLIVASRLAILTISLVALAKWFPRS